jgi:hypothetical protein
VLHLPLLRLETRVLATTHSLLRRVWAFLVQFLVRVTTHSLLPREWVAAALVVQAVLVQLALELVLLVQVVRAVLVQPALALLVRADLAVHAQALPADLAQALAAAQAQEPVEHLVASLVRPVAAQLVDVEETPRELLAHSVRVAHAVRARLARASVQSAKSLSREAMPQALVEQLFHAETEPPFFVCVAEPASKTLPTRLRQMQVS